MRIRSFIKFSCWLSAFTLVAATQAVSAQEVLFETAFRHAIRDKALDRQEFAGLIERAQKITNPEDIHLANGLFEILTQYQGLVHLSFRYTYRQQKKDAAFLFSPTYSEDDPLKAKNAAEFLGKIAQQDLMPDTLGDNFRCGAASLLAGHYILYGNLSKAFRQLKLTGEVTYRQMHWAQEKLYRLANIDGEDGLTQRLVYKILNDGRIKILEHEGEIETAARKIGLQIVPLKITVQEELLDRQRVILDLWRRQPRIPLLVGVYLDPDTGDVFPPDEIKRVQNHFVLVFRDSPQVWMYNSGVVDNGQQRAIRQLNTQELRDFVMKTKGSVNALLRTS